MLEITIYWRNKKTKLSVVKTDFATTRPPTGRPAACVDLAMLTCVSARDAVDIDEDDDAVGVSVGVVPGLLEAHVLAADDPRTPALVAVAFGVYAAGIVLVYRSFNGEKRLVFLAVTYHVTFIVGTKV